MSDHHPAQRGLTLPELVVSLAVVSTLTVGAGQQFTRLLQENRMATEVNRFMGALQLARYSAVTQARRVVLCPSRDGVNCGRGADWVRGWLLFQSDDREHDPEEPLLQAGGALTETIRMQSGNHRKRVVYQQDGSSGGTNSSFTFCDRQELAKPRVICLSNSGRPRLAHTRCDGKPVRCAAVTAQSH
jgi:type IV fimbrial biogenesis protein FimT